MIGVIADPAYHEVIGEFFELFKTPWEFYQANRQYDVLLSDGSGPLDYVAKLILVYAGREIALDSEREILPRSNAAGGRIFRYRDRRIPIYGDSVSFRNDGEPLLTDELSQETVAHTVRCRGTLLARIGYDLFEEIRTLLSVGQPAANASIPALDLHILLLRELILSAGLSLTEIPPVPHGYRFIACLTHDVDHPSIRKHKFDHTTFGFLYRATLGCFSKFLRGQLGVSSLAASWAAAFKLPFMYLGFANDIWRNFDQRYLRLEKGLTSTFFLIPFAGRPGKTAQGPAPKRRAARYSARDLADCIYRLKAAGREIALHGIDAWVDSDSGKQELQEVQRLAETSQIGVRMHWLYYDERSPATLEAAGAAYDSTVGYNQTVGYRAGTTQVFRPLGARRLLELPLHIMDTALFYPAYLGLSRKEADAVLNGMVEAAAQFGGCLTINWHDRSLAPERLWDCSYRDLLENLKRQGAWFATAGEAVAWFRKRRSARFDMDCDKRSAVRVPVSGEDHLPDLQLQIHGERATSGAAGAAPHVETAPSR